MKRLEKIAKDLYKDARNSGIPKGECASDNYVKALVYLHLEYAFNLYDCETKGVPWYPRDAEKFAWARSEVEKYTLEKGEYSSLPEWPNPGEIPQPPREKTEKELLEERAKAWKRLEEIEKPNPGADATTNAVNTVMKRLIVGIYGRPPSDGMVREEDKS